MKLKNIEQAKKLLPQLVNMEKALKLLEEDTTEIAIQGQSIYPHIHFLPKSLKIHFIEIIRTKCECIKKELEQL